MSKQEWVAGFVNWTGTTPFQYRNHNYSQCGSSDYENMCGNNYYVNTPLGGGTSQYSVCDRQLNIETCLGTGGCPANGCCLNYEVCPNIGQIQAQPQWSQWGNAKNGMNQTKSSSKDYTNTTPQIACLYPLSTFQTLENVLEFKNKFGTNPNDPKDAYTYQILPLFCLTQTTECPENPATGFKMSHCSRFVSDNSNDPCKGYLASLVDLDHKNGTTLADQAFTSYCTAFNTPDCDCINRFTNPAYQIMSVGQNVQNDSCWWAPCKDSVNNGSTYLVPSSLPPCNADNVLVCNNVNVVVGGNSSGLTFNPQLYTTCTLTDNPYVGPGGNPSSSSTSSLWWIFLIAIIIIIIVILLLIFV